MSFPCFTDRAKILGFAPVIAQFIFALVVTVGAVAGGAWGGIGIGGALLLALAVGWGQGRVPRPTLSVVLFLCAFFIFATLSSVQAVDPSLSWRVTLRMATILIPLSFFLSPAVGTACAKEFHRLPTLLLLSLAGLMLLAVASIIGGVTLGASDTGFVTKLNRGFSYFLMLGWPMGAACLSFDWKENKPNRWKVLVFIVVFLVALAANHSRAAQSGAVLSSGVFLVALFLPRLVAGGLAGVTVLAAAWPFGASWLYQNKLTWVLSLPKSWLARMEIWDYMSYRILERPLTGYGLGNSAKVSIETPHSSLYLFATQPAAHPHNAMTQLLGEMGLPGLVWGLFFALWALRQASRLPANLRPAALAAYALTFWLTMTAYNFWTDSLWAAMALTAFAFALLRRGGKELKLL